MKLQFLLPLLAILVIMFGVLGAVAKRRGSRGAGGDEPWPFYAKRLMSAPEQILYHRLVEALPDHIVLAQVQVSRVLGVKKGFKRNEWNNRISQLSYDFVVCSKDSSVVAAIELDDQTHEASDRKETDKKKERATAAAGVKMLRWNVKALPGAEIIKNAFAPSQPDAGTASRS